MAISMSMHALFCKGKLGQCTLIRGKGWRTWRDLSWKTWDYLTKCHSKTSRVKHRRFVAIWSFERTRWSMYSNSKSTGSLPFDQTTLTCTWAIMQRNQIIALSMHASCTYKMNRPSSWTPTEDHVWSFSKLVLRLARLGIPSSTHASTPTCFCLPLFCKLQQCASRSS